METETVSTNPAFDQIAAALAKAQGRITNPPKNRVADCGKRGKYFYADLADVLEHVRVPLSENGLSVVQIVQPGKLITRILHSSGQYLESIYPLPQMGDMSAQDMGSAITYARRYSLCPMLGVAGETDDDAQGAAAASEAKKEAEAEEARIKARKALDEAKGDGRIKSAYTGETLQPGQDVSPTGETVGAPVVKDPHKTPESCGPKALAGIAPELAQLMAASGFTPAQIKDFYVSKGHKPASMEPKDLPADYIRLITTEKNWESVKKHIAKGKTT